jgi:tRNA pseudouridine38-40 synthase
MKPTHFYIIHIQYLGFRFHGWAKQPQVKTVHHMIDRTLKYVFEDRSFKTLGGSRTDAMVSAADFVLELFLDTPLADEAAFLADFNLNLPPDIKALGIEQTDKDFNIIQHPKSKEYVYLFAHGEKAHPFAAPFVTTIPNEFDIDLMKRGARLFEGEHEFRAYCKKPKEETKTIRTIDRCELITNDLYTASFFPKNSYAVVFEAKGFMRNQIRLMMGQLFRLGKGEIGLQDIEESLIPSFDQHLDYVAPASGLILQRVSLN